MNPKYIIDNMNLKAWTMQGMDFVYMKNGTTLFTVVHWMSNSDADHPFTQCTPPRQ